MSDSTNERMADDDLVPLDEIRRRHVTMVLEACGGNRTNAAQVLNIDRKTLYRKLLRWGLASRP
jgi:transcriptional regulator of acetoin/glycerol metabolism